MRRQLLLLPILGVLLAGCRATTTFGYRELPLDVVLAEPASSPLEQEPTDEELLHEESLLRKGRDADAPERD